MFKISVQKEFSAAHKLVGYPGVCRRIHGHNWKVRAVVATHQVDEIGIGVDFTMLDDILEQTVSRLDHQLINEIEPFDQINPTAEHLAKFIFDSIKDKLPKNVKPIAVEVAESDGFVVIYEP